MENGNGADLLWLFVGMMFGGNGFFGNRGPIVPPVNTVTEADLQASQNAQTQQLMLDGIKQQLSDNRFDITQAISHQTFEMQTQNNANTVNVIQGFNTIGSKIDNLSAQINQCCCEIKTMMLQNRLEDAQAKIVAQQNEISNLQQTQSILGTMGRWVGWVGSGSQTASTT